MSDSLKEYAYSKQELLTFFVPFFLFGTIFSIVAILHVSQSPVSQLPVDYFYAVFCGFVDMGTVFGVISLVVFSLFKKLKRSKD